MKDFIRTFSVAVINYLVSSTLLCVLLAASRLLTGVKCQTHPPVLSRLWLPIHLRIDFKIVLLPLKF